MKDEREILEKVEIEELKQQARAHIRSLKHTYAGHCEFSFRQSDKLAPTGYRKSQGICMTLALDWLRRHLHNRGRPDSKQKRDYGDAKYRSRRGNKALIHKIAAAHDVYEHARGRNYSAGAIGALDSFRRGAPAEAASRRAKQQLRLLPRFACLSTSEVATSTSRTLDGLQKSTVKRWLFEEIAAYYRQCLPVLNQGNIPGLGIILSLSGGGEGHAVAFLLSPEDIRFFDPNVGSYRFHREAEALLSFDIAATLWAEWYYPIPGFREAKFEPIFFENQTGGLQLVQDEDSSEW